jgi:hypothetical protein
MVFATVLLLCPLPQAVDVARSVAETPMAVTTSTSANPAPAKPLPSSPEPKIKTAALAASNGAAAVAPAAVAAGSPLPAMKPGKLALARDYETERQRKEWYALALASSGAAVFDAWSTRRAVSNGWGTEANPLLRPFSHSNAMYAATQISPLVLDLIGRKMMTSRHLVLRRLWWLPQSAGLSTSALAGLNNLTIAH